MYLARLGISVVRALVMTEGVLFPAGRKKGAWVEGVAQPFYLSFFSEMLKYLYFFDIVGGMCSSLICQTLKTQLNLLHSKLLLSSSFLSLGSHVRIWALKFKLLKPIDSGIT